MDETPIGSFATLTFALLALAGTAMVLVGLWLLAIRKVSLAGAPSEPVLEAEVTNFVTVKTRMPALGLIVLGVLSIVGASQLAHQARQLDMAQAEKQRLMAMAREESRRLDVTGHVEAIDQAAVPGAHLTLLTKHADLNPLNDGSIRAYVWTGSRLLELRIRSVGRAKPDVTIAIEQPSEDGSLTLPDIDLDELLGEITVGRAAPVPTPVQPLPNRTATPAFGSEKP